MVATPSELLASTFQYLTHSDEIRVVWDSTRSNEEQFARGTVEHAIWRDNKMKLIFRRKSDSQRMEIRDDGKIYSHGSQYPLTGTVKNIDVNV